MSKGSNRRPRQTSRQEFDRRWEATFGKCSTCGKRDNSICSNSYHLKRFEMIPFSYYEVDPEKMTAALQAEIDEEVKALPFGINALAHGDFEDGTACDCCHPVGGLGIRREWRGH